MSSNKEVAEIYHSTASRLQNLLQSEYGSSEEIESPLAPLGTEGGGDYRLNIDSEDAVISAGFQIERGDEDDAWLVYEDRDGNRIEITEASFRSHGSDYHVFTPEEALTRVSNFSMQHGEFWVSRIELDGEAEIYRSHLDRGAEENWEDIRGIFRS